MYNLYSVKDDTADKFGPPFPTVNDGVALRHYFQMMKDVYNPSEFSLYFLGEWNDKTGVMVFGDLRKLLIPEVKK